MKYSEQDAALLMDMFRHKIVHLAARKPVVEFRGKKVAWRYRHANAAIHLALEPVNPPAQLQALTDLQVKFVVAVYDFYDPLQ